MKEKENNSYEGEIPNTPVKFLWYLGKKHRLLGGASFLFVILAETLNTLLIYISARMVDAFSQADTLIAQKETLLSLSALFMLAYVGHIIFYRLSGFSSVSWVIKFHNDGYNEMYEYLSRHSHTYFSDRFAGSLSNKISNAVDSSAGLAFQILYTFFSEFVGLFVTLVLFFMVDVRVGSILLIAFILVLGANIFATHKRRPYVVAYSLSSSRSRGEGVDMITNIGAVRQFSQGKFELTRLANVFLDRAQKDTKQAFFGEFIMVLNSAFAIVMTVAVLVLMYVLLTQNATTAGTLVLVLGLLGRVGYMFISIGQSLNRFVRDYGNVEEGLQEILINHEITDSSDAKKLSVAKGEVKWSDVTFEYGENKVFDSFNLTIKPGERVGLVGSSGAGKTTFVSLLLRQHDISGGVITIDGQNIALVTQDSLRENIAVVPQEPMLFHRTIRENIAYGKPDATDAEIIAVAKKAQAHDFIDVLPEKYNTMVGERGIKLSGGQKQRVAIARAMLKNAPILILDE
ncbi:MAG: transporter ATP-binding protein, partial [Candidatus Parcubacteria bacterium]